MSWFGRRETRATAPGGAAGRGAATQVAEAPADGAGAADAADGAGGALGALGAPAVPAPVLTIDALGRKCPIPIIMLAEQIRDVPVGQIIAVLADDPAAYTDVPAWCGMKSHEFVVSRELPSGWAFLIRRRY
jgi:tRNA 2-thiouridine synthesizing protein A